MQYDFIIIGGGIFGSYAACYLAEKGARVCLLEKENALFLKASVVNQARLHGGYHYPRSIATAALSDEHKLRFTNEHKPFVNSSFQKFYAIDKAGSFTDAAQFERFAQYLGIRCERILEHPLFNFQKIEALFLTEEFSFDPVLIADFYKEKIAKNNSINLFLNAKITAVENAGSNWQLTFQQDSLIKIIESPIVINATYAATNSINQLFGVRELDLMHEISEMAFIQSPQLKQIGLTVMDGPFGSLMPYGLSDLLSLSSVVYTHHKVSYDNLPSFDCQQINTACKPNFLSDCNTCFAKPRSNSLKMLAQIRGYFSENVELNYLHSMFTIKSKLKASHIDDGRPTEISLLHDKPKFYCLFAGKINSIYEVEKII